MDHAGDHPFWYSLVVDAVPDHPYQAEILLLTLTELAAVPPDRIVVQCTSRVEAGVADRFRANGHVVTVVEPYLDGKYCNKLRQLDHFVRAGGEAAAGVFLIDVDVAVVAPLDVSDREQVWGKIVDGPNPPLEVTRGLFAAAGVPMPEPRPCDWGTGEAVSTNLNGGFLYVPMAMTRRLQTAWCRWGELLFSRPDLFDAPAQRTHIDQLAFALTLASERIPYGHLRANDNFPCHTSRRPLSHDPEAAIRVLHYHWNLDRFGALSPVFSEPGVIDGAVDRVNDAIAAHEPMFFGRYRRHLATEAIGAVPDVDEDRFAPHSPVRSRPDSGRRRRLILHTGTPKTGTSSLQFHLAGNRGTLAERGVWYPPPDLTGEPKHQQLVPLLIRADERAFVGYVDAALADMPEATHTIVFSTEGIFNHWWDYPAESKALLRHLAGWFDFELCVWFREPVSFAASLYAQYLRNPEVQGAASNVYGRDIDFADAMDDDWFRRHLDYLGFWYETRELFGDDRVQAFLFDDDTVDRFMTHYAIDPVPREHGRRNDPMSRAGIEITRIVNRYGVPQPEKREIELLTYEIDRIIGDRADGFRLDADERRLVERFAAQGWRSLRDEWA